MVLKLQLDKDGNVAARPSDWTEALPHPDETEFICIVAGNSNLAWALHDGRQDGFAPRLFWRTPPIEEAEISEEGACGTLARHIPTQMQVEIFGPGSSASNLTMEMATRVAAAKRVPARTVYVLTTNQNHEKALLHTFSGTCHRMFRLENTDFFSPEDGCYETLGPDRAACLYAGCVMKAYHMPLLVMDAGTAWTYTGLDNTGKIMGGGISPGLGARFRALSDYCGKLPSISFGEYNAILKAIDDNEQEALPVFAKDTKTAIATSVFQEVSAHCQGIINHFLTLTQKMDPGDSAKTANAEKEPATNGNNAFIADKSATGCNDTLGSEKETSLNGNDGPQRANKPTVLITGGDSGFLIRCLTRPGHNFPAVPGAKPFSDEIYLQEIKHLNHYGIGQLIQNKFKERGELSEEDKLRDLILGQRVAKEFDLKDLDGEGIYRGSIIAVLRGQELEHDLYMVRYDDGDEEQLSLPEVYEALKLYTRTGEKGKAELDTWTQEKRAERKKGATESALKIYDGIPRLQEILKENAEKENPNVAAVAAAAETGEPAPTPVLEKASNSPHAHSEKRQRTPASERLDRPKKAKEASEATAEAGKQYLQMRVAKYFEIESDDGKLENILFKGTVTSYDAKSKYWHIEYDDDDEEDFDAADLTKAIKLYAQTEKENSASAAQPVSEVALRSPVAPTTGLKGAVQRG